MTVSTSVVTIDDDDFARSTIPYIAVWEMLFNRWEEQRGAEILNFGIGQLQEMYNYYNKTTFEKQSWTHYKMGKGRLNI
jgi:hypothetical protein